MIFGRELDLQLLSFFPSYMEVDDLPPIVASVHWCSG
jgi:hypothetical protein